MTLPRGAPINDRSYVMYIARFHRLPVPKADRISRDYAVIAYGVHRHHTIRIAPRLIEFAP